MNMKLALNVVVNKNELIKQHGSKFVLGIPRVETEQLSKITIRFVF
jgi:hypothetical protein